MLLDHKFIFNTSFVLPAMNFGFLRLHENIIRKYLIEQKQIQLSQTFWKYADRFIRILTFYWIDQDAVILSSVWIYVRK